MENLLKELQTRQKIDFHKSKAKQLEADWLDELANHHRDTISWDREDTEESWDNVMELYNDIQKYNNQHKEVLKLDDDTRLTYSIMEDLKKTCTWHTNFIDYVQGDNNNLYNTACEFADKIENYDS